jgi:hypothetical protein
MQSTQRSHLVQTNIQYFEEAKSNYVTVGSVKSIWSGVTKTLLCIRFWIQLHYFGSRTRFRHLCIIIAKYVYSCPFYTYNEANAPISKLFEPDSVGSHANPDWYITKPIGYSSFRLEVAPVPASWVATTGNLVFYRRHEKV